MYIYFEEGQQVTEEILNTMEAAAKYCLELEGIDEERTEISVTFVEAEKIRELNRDYRDNDKVTDVLSFPQFDDLNDIPDFGEICLGDVVICKDRAEEQAEEFGHSFEREIIYLFTHSILHLLGYDHMEEDEKKEMRAREEEVMTHLGIGR
ncbi:MAG: rRNA maturation RNase YbeY [Firmicutes bacterium]|nr:rRNA maturation RNase YbeY [Bacillota bacterium]